MLYNINNFISNSGWKYLFYGIDIILVTILFYILYIFVYNTRAYNVVAGFIILFFITLIARVFGLTTLSWIFDKFFQVGLIAIVVLFQAEIRHGLRILGGRALFKKSFGYDENNIQKILSAAFNLSYKGHGALIVFQRNISLHSLIDRAIRLNADISIELIESIFFKNNPIHDGAAIIMENKIAAASAYLPLTEMEPKIKNRRLGTRHRAALGISEQTDAVILVVSEETQSISIVHNGILEYDLNRDELYARLGELLEIK